MRRLGRSLIEAGKGWKADRAPRLAAALSYYTVFSLPPLLVSLIALAGLFAGTEEVRRRLLQQIGGLIGREPAQLLEAAIAEAQQIEPGLGLLVGLGALIFGATGAFGQLQDALNTIWNVPPNPKGGIGRFLRSRLLSLAAVLGAGFLLLVSLAVSTAIAALVEWFERFDRLAPFLALIDLAVSLVVVTLVFALIFKFLPDVELEWRHVWVGAAFTSVLFTGGKFAIGFYLGTSEIGSAYGAAGSLIVILVWIYYSSLIVLFGAELTQVWSGTRRQHPPSPTPAAPRATVPEPPLVLVLGAFVLGWLTRRSPGKSNRS